ncbi:AAA family ATPase [candidate division KSB1 bacterium]|nr:AAA family ATPase [candidate division KSB1 bacterium]
MSTIVDSTEIQHLLHPSLADADLTAPSFHPRVMAVAGGKGGVGKTLVTSMIALVLAEMGKKTVLVDSDFYGPNLHYLFNIYPAQQSLSDYFGESCDINDMVVPSALENLSLIPATSDNRRSFQPAAWQVFKLIRNLRKIQADYVILDLGPGAQFTNMDIFLSADDQLLVSTCENIALYGAYQFIRSTLFRKLQRRNPDWPAFGSELVQCGDLMQGRKVKTVVDFLNTAQDYDMTWQFRLMSDIQNFRPKLVVNNILETDAASQFQALRLASKEALSVELNFWGSVQYDAAVRTAVRRNQPLDLLRLTQAGQQITRLVHKQIVVRDSRLTSSAKRLQHDWNRVRICSHRCIAWTCCDKRNGGTPCAVMHPDLAYGKAVPG